MKRATDLLRVHGIAIVDGGLHGATAPTGFQRSIYWPGRPIATRRIGAGDTLIGESRPHTTNHPMAEPLQLPLFPDQAALARIRPERNVSPGTSRHLGFNQFEKA
jgi:hypothetical protein